MNKRWMGNTSFGIVYFVLTAVSFNSLIAGRSGMQLINGLVMLLGFGLICLRVFFRKDYRKDLLQGLLILFGISYIVSSVINYRYGVTGNIKAVLWMSFQFLILYAIPKQWDGRQIRNHFCLFAHVVVGYTFIQAVISLGMLLFSYGELNAQWHRVGLVSGRLWGTYTDPNYGALLAVAAMGFTFFLLRTVKEKKRNYDRIYLYSNLFLQYIYIVFSGSRTGLFTMGVVLLGWLFYDWYFRRKKWRELLLSFVLIMVGIFGSTYLQQGYNNLGAEKGASVETMQKAAIRPAGFRLIGIQKNGTEVIGRVEDLSQDWSNGRMQIWKCGVEIFRENPVFGISFRNVHAYAKENMADSYLVSNPYGYEYDAFHNMFVDILVSQGIIGLFLMVGIIIWILYRTIRMWKYCSKESKELVIACFGVLAAISCGSCFLTDIIYLNTPTSVVFWTVLGCMMGGINQVEEKKK